MFGSSYTGANVYRSAQQINSAMGRVYGHMALAVITSMIVSFLVGNSAALMTFFFTGAMKWVVIFALLVAILVHWSYCYYYCQRYQYFYR